MTGWTADGNTHPRFRSCDHVLGRNGRCSFCNAKPWPGFVQPGRSGALGALPIGSPDLVTPQIRGIAGMKPIGQGKSPREWNGDVKGERR